jgi:hypothetical protein
MCGCGMAGNNGDIKSPDSPMMVVPDMFGGMLDTTTQTEMAGSNNSIHQTPPVNNRTGMESVGNTN